MNPNDATDTNDDQRLHLYFERQAAAVFLPEGDPQRVAARADHRRRTRRTIGGIAATLVLVFGAFGILAGRTEQEVTVGSPTNTAVVSAPSNLRWTTVDVPVGLGTNTTDAVTTSDGSLYSLSTAPGRPNSSANPNPYRDPATLYRSADGKTWTTTSLPAGLSASALATSPGHLYAVGTAPAGGGGIDLVVASSTDGADTWTQSRLPAPDGGLKARFPEEVQISGVRIANGPSGLLAAVTVSASPRPERLLARNGIAFFNGYASTPTGVDVYRAQPACAPFRGTMVPPTTAPPGTDPVSVPTGPPSTRRYPPSVGTSPDTRAPEAQRAAVGPEVVNGTIPGGISVDNGTIPLNGTVPMPPGCMTTLPVEKSYTWAELGLEPELLALTGGQVRVYASADGQAFTDVSPGGVPGLRGTDIGGFVGSADGYRLLLTSFGIDHAMPSYTVHQAFSPDGRTWTVTGTGSGADGWVQSTGHLGAIPAAILHGNQGTVLLTAAAGGGWNSVNISNAVQAASGIPGANVDVVVGPLGLIGISWGGDADQTFVVESTDGQSFSAHRLDDLGVRGGIQPLGLTMNADAVVIRLLTDPGDESEASKPIPPQRLLVGTRN